MKSKLNLSALAAVLAVTATLAGAQPADAGIIDKAKGAAKTVGGGIKDGAKAIGRGAKSVAGDIKDGAVTVGRGLKQGARDYGTFVKDWAKAATHNETYDPAKTRTGLTGVGIIGEAPGTRKNPALPRGVTIDHRGKVKIIDHRSRTVDHRGASKPSAGLPKSSDNKS